MTSHNRILAVGVLGSALLAGATRAAAQDTFNWSGRVAAGDAIEIRGIGGDIRAVASSGDEVRVSARKSARRSNPDDVRIEVVEHAGGVTICALYPAPSNRPPNECRPGGGGNNNTRNNDVEVAFTVEVPRGVNFVGRNVNGNVSATSLSSEVRAYTVNGSVNASTSEIAEASTVNGSVRVSMGRTNWNGDLEFESVNGTVDVSIGGEVNTDVTASTVNGSISSDFPLTVRGRFGPKRLTGTIGNGGRSLTLTTVNGNIELRRM
jgi:hypothetical protein